MLSSLFKYKEKVKMIHLRATFSNNKKWKNTFFFTSGDWELSPSEVERSSRVTWETRVPFAKAHKHPNLTDKEGDCGKDHGLCSVKKE